MKQAFRQLLGSDTDGDIDSEESTRTDKEVKWAIESIMGASFEWGDSFYITLTYEELDQLQELRVYPDEYKSSRSIKLLREFPQVFKANLLVRLTEDGEVDGIDLQSVFYAIDERRNEPIGKVARWIGYSGPHLTFDIEGDTPEIVIYSSRFHV